MKLTRLLNRLTNIRPEEAPRALLLFLATTLTNLGLIWAVVSIFATLVKQAGGLDALVWVVILSSILSIFASAVYSAFADRIANDILMIIIFGIEFLGIGAGLLLIWLDLSTLAYPFLYLWLLALVAVLNPHQITYISSFYDTQAAKRTLPVITAGYRAGAIIAGLSLLVINPWLDRNAWLSRDAILLFWLLAHLGVALIAWFMPIWLHEGRTPTKAAKQPGQTAAQQSETYLESMQEGFRYTMQSAYLRWTALGTLLLMALMYMLEYRYGQILRAEVDDLSSFMAVLSAGSNLLILPIALFGLSRVIARFGVGNTSLIFPTGNLLVCGSLIFFPGVITASAAFVDRSAFRLAVHAPVDGLLYNAVPTRIKGRARAFANGLVVPLGSLVGGLLLLLPWVSTIWYVPALIGGFAGVYLISALVIRKLYSQALIKMLEQEDFLFLLQSDSALVAADPATLDLLKKKLVDSPDVEFTIFMAQLISQVGGSQAVPILRQTAEAAADGEIRAAIVNVVATAAVQEQAVQDLFIDFLADPDGRVRQAAVTGLEQLVGPTDERFLTLVSEMLYDPDIGVRTRILSTIARSGNFYQTPPVVESLNQFLADPDPERRAQAMRILSQIGDERAIKNLIAYLADTDDQVRLAAAISLEEAATESLSGPLKSAIVEQMRSLLADPVQRIRQVALLVLGRLGDHEVYPLLVKALKDASPAVSETAVEVLIDLGKPIIPIAYTELESSDAKLRKMVSTVLGRIDTRQFGGLIEAQINSNLLTIYRNYTYIESLSSCAADYASIAILQSVLNEQCKQLRDEIFFMLETLHASMAVEVIVDTLRSQDSRKQANAIEALESLTNPQTAQLMAPLFRSDLTPKQLMRFGYEAWEMRPVETAQAIRQLATDPNSFWLRAIMTYALGEMGVALRQRQPAPTEAATDDPPVKKRRRPRVDPLAALADSNDGQQKKRRRRGGMDLLGKLAEDGASEKETVGAEAPAEAAPPPPPLLELSDIEGLLETSARDSAPDVCSAARTAKRMLAGIDIVEEAKKEEVLLSTVERIIFLKQVPFFKGMTIAQLEVLAKICEEEVFETDQWIFHQGDPGGAMYVIISGQVGIEQEKRKKSYARLATLGPYHYFGEMSLLDDSARSAGAVALQDTFILRLRREPLIVLARQYPDVSLELIRVLSERLRQANNRIAELTRSRPRELQKLFDALD